METIAIDGMDEDDFRHSIEDMLRLDRVDEAIDRLRALLKPYTGEGGILPSRFLDVSSGDVEFAGWERLADRLCDHDRPSHRISAIGVTLADARALGGPGPSGGRLPPFIKTFYFSDDAYPFSDATRDDLLDGYSREGFEWQGDYQATDATLSIKGLDDLYGTIVELEEQLFKIAEPPEDQIRAGTIGACYLAALIHQSLRETIREKGLPRPLCVIAACDGVYPFFDAPVAGSDECTVEKPAATASGEVWPNELEGAYPAEEGELEEDGPAEASLLSLVSHKGTKKPVIVLSEEDANEAARFTEMASAQRLAPDDEHAREELIENAHRAELAGAAAMEAAAAWDEPGWPAPAAEPEAPPVLAREPRFDPLPEADLPGAVRVDLPDPVPVDAQDGPVDPPGFAQAPAATFEQEPPHGTDWPLAPVPDSLDVAEAFPQLPEEPAAAVEEIDEVPLGPPAGHSLRAKIKLAEPDMTVTWRERLAAFFERIKRKILRRRS